MTVGSGLGSSLKAQATELAHMLSPSSLELLQFLFWVHHRSLPFSFLRYTFTHIIMEFPVVIHCLLWPRAGYRVVRIDRSISWPDVVQGN